MSFFSDFGGEIVGAVGSVGSSLISGGLGYLGAQQSNEDVRKMQKEQQDFQRSMYRKRYRYQMDDMRKAGLNPILSYSQGPPGGPAGSSPIQPLNELGAIGANLGQGVNSAIAAAGRASEIKKRKEEVKAIGAQVSNIKADTDLKKEATRVQTQEQLLKQVQTYLTNNQATLVNAQATKIAEDTMMVQLQRKIALELEKIRGYESMRTEQKEEVWSGLSGKILTWIDEVGQALNPFASARESHSRTGRNKRTGYRSD